MGSKAPASLQKTAHRASNTKARIVPVPRATWSCSMAQTVPSIRKKKTKAITPHTVLILGI